MIFCSSTMVAGNVKRAKSKAPFTTRPYRIDNPIKNLIKALLMPIILISTQGKRNILQITFFSSSSLPFFVVIAGAASCALISSSTYYSLIFHFLLAPFAMCVLYIVLGPGFQSIHIFFFCFVHFNAHYLQFVCIMIKCLDNYLSCIV